MIRFPIPFPKFLIHHVSKGLSDNPQDKKGQGRAAFNLGPLGIWIDDDTASHVIEQEKVEVYLTSFSIFLCAVIFWLTFISWWSLLALIPFLIYPTSGFFHYPGSRVFRRFFEIRTHAIMGRAYYLEWFADQPSEFIEQVAREWAARHARSMESYGPYDLDLKAIEIERRLIKFMGFE